MTEHPIVLGGRYKLDQVIGRGGMAEVWRARDLRLGRDVAVKRLRVDLATDPTFQARFQREAQSAAGLNHPNVVATYDTGDEPDEKTGIHVPFIVMELVEGHTLRDLLRADRRILPEKALEWTQGVLDALNYSHRAGIIHRDIKPANVMLTPAGTVKVMDFGIARAVADTSATMTQTAAVIGTAQYLSPEQARGETVDSRSDIYSAGCLLYELLCGRPPFVGDSPVSVAYQHVREAPMAPSTLDPEITPEMDAVVLKALAKDPADRYQTGKEMRDDIARLLAGTQVLAMVQPDTSVGQPTEPTRVVPGAPRPAAAVAPVPVAAGSTATSPSSAAPLVEEEPERRRSPMTWLIIALLTALVAVIGWVGYGFLKPVQNTSRAMVPSVIGLPETAATSQLETAGFAVKAAHQTGPAATENQVVEQDPKGVQADKGSTVAITINDGPKTITVPDGLVGLDEKAARALLVKAGFSSKLISTTSAQATDEAAHPDVKAGQVVTSNPAAGAQVPASQKVVLSLATGKRQVPDLTGMTVRRAREAAQEAGFGVAADAGTNDSVVDTQSPEPGTLLERGATINVRVKATAPTPSATPSPSVTQSSSPAPDATDTAPETPDPGTSQTPEAPASTPAPTQPSATAIASTPAPAATPS